MGHPRLLNRGGRYYLRAKVPAGLVPVLRRREVKRALGIGDYRKAVERLRLASAQVDAEFAEARRKAAPRPRTELSEHEVGQLALLWFAEEEQWAAQEAVAHPPDDHETYLENVASDEAIYSMPLDEGMLPNVCHAVNGLLERQNISLAPASEAYWRLCDMVRRGMAEGARRALRRYRGDYSERGGDPAFDGVGAESAPPPPVTAPPRRALTLAELVERYMGDAARAHLTAKTRDGYLIVFRALKELLGPDRPIDGITREDYRRVRDVLAWSCPALVDGQGLGVGGVVLWFLSYSRGER